MVLKCSQYTESVGSLSSPVVSQTIFPFPTCSSPVFLFWEMDISVQLLTSVRNHSFYIPFTAPSFLTSYWLLSLLSPKYDLNPLAVSHLQGCWLYAAPLFSDWTLCPTSPSLIQPPYSCFWNTSEIAIFLPQNQGGFPVAFSCCNSLMSFLYGLFILVSVNLAAFSVAHFLLLVTYPSRYQTSWISRHTLG